MGAIDGFILGFAVVAGSATAMGAVFLIMRAGLFLAHIPSRYRQARHPHFRSPKPPLGRRDAAIWAVSAAWAWDM